MKDNSKGTMKRKLVLSVFVALVFVLGFITMVFYTISTYESEDNTKEQLGIYAYLLSEQISNVDEQDFSKIVDRFSSSNVRVTIIDKNGYVKFDSLGNVEKLENHNDREEVIMARSKGEGVATRYSESEEKYILYSAVAISDGTVVRTSTSVKSTHELNHE